VLPDAGHIYEPINTMVLTEKIPSGPNITDNDITQNDVVSNIQNLLGKEQNKNNRKTS
jgi:hypothetical protein